MRTETAKTLEESSRLHQWAQQRMTAFRKEFEGVSPLYESNLSNGIVAGLRDAYRRIFEEGYFGRTVHDVVSYYNNGERGRGDDQQNTPHNDAQKFHNPENDNGVER